MWAPYYCSTSADSLASLVSIAANPNRHAVGSAIGAIRSSERVTSYRNISSSSVSFGYRTPIRCSHMFTPGYQQLRARYLLTHIPYLNSVFNLKLTASRDNPSAFFMRMNVLDGRYFRRWSNGNDGTNIRGGCQEGGMDRPAELAAPAERGHMTLTCVTRTSCHVIASSPSFHRPQTNCPSPPPSRPPCHAGKLIFLPGEGGEKTFH